MNVQKFEIPFGAGTLIIETGKLAKQANAAVTVTLGGTTVLVEFNVLRATQRMPSNPFSNPP